MSNGKMLEAIALDLAAVLPSHWVDNLHIVVGILGVPMDIFTSTDAYYFCAIAYCAGRSLLVVVSMLLMLCMLWP